MIESLSALQRHDVAALAPAVSEPDLCWLAGLLEGEASFLFMNGSPSIQIQMVDSDVIARVTALFDCKTRASWRSKLGNRQLVHSCVLHGTRAIAWMLKLLPHMGVRRAAQIEKVVQSWTKAGRPKAPRGVHLPAICHPERARTAFGLCKRCYMQQWRGLRKVGVT